MLLSVLAAAFCLAVGQLLLRRTGLTPLHWLIYAGTVHGGPRPGAGLRRQPRAGQVRGAVIGLGLVLQRLLGVTKGNLSAHLAKLEAAGLVTAGKKFVRSVPQTTLTITPAGRQARARHWAQLERMRSLGAPPGTP